MIINIVAEHALRLMAATACQTETGTSCSDGLPHTAANNTTIEHILTVVFATIAALAVLMIVIAGLRFVTGQGSPQETAKARNTIIYAVAGLLIALAAQSVVLLVFKNLTS